MNHVKMYHPNGAEVFLEIAGNFENATSTINSYIGNGWLIDKPPRQHQNVIGWIVRRSKIEDDGSETPLLDLYVDHPDMYYKILSKYLNNPKEVQEFENAAGVKVNDMPFYDGSSAPKRGDAKGAKYFFRLPQPLRIYYRDNPYYNPDETDATKKKAQFTFASWGEKVAEQGKSQTESRPSPDSDDAPVLSSRLYHITSVDFAEVKGKKMMLANTKEDTILSFDTTRPFAEQSYPVKEWAKAKSLKLDYAIGVFAYQDANRVWHVERFEDIPF